MSVVRKLDHK